MRHPAILVRVFVGIALVATALAFAPVAGAQGNQASITLYKAVCPEGYTGTDFYEDCYANPGNGYTFFLDGPGYSDSAVTAGNGFTAFEGIGEDGTYELTEAFPEDVIDFAVFCSKGGEAFPFFYISGGIELDLTTDDDIRCDWYNIPVGPGNNDLASVTIYKAVCPPEYTGDDFYGDCYGTPGAGYTFTLTGPDYADEATTGDDGFTFFEGIGVGGVHTLLEYPPVDIAGFVVYCSEDGEEFPVTAVEGGVELDLDINDDLRCDWFNIPADNELASVTIYKAVCPAGYEDDNYFEDCYETPGSGIDFAISGPGGEAEATTGDDGIVAFEGIDTAGTYTVTETFPEDIVEYVVFCSEAGEPFDLTYVENGIDLDLALDDDVRCDWYNIPEKGAASPSPSPSGSPQPSASVSTLPNTGTGSTAGGNAAALLAIPALIVLAIVGAAWSGARGRRRAA